MPYDEALRKAALDTFTGRQAAARGFTTVDITVLRGNIGEYTEVEVVFR